jgi:hypothetical protein
VQINETFVHLKLVAVPGLRTLTARLTNASVNEMQVIINARGDTDSLTGCDFKDLGGEANRTFDTELLVLCTVDEVGGNYV